MPHEDFVYLGDGARCPYGPRPAEEIRRFALELGAHLEREEVKLIVAACNSATAAALPELQRELTVPVVGVLSPEAHAAVQATRNRRIGVLATDATVESDRYAKAIHELDAGCEVVSVACPTLVPMIEAGGSLDGGHRRSSSRLRGAASARRRRHGHPRVHPLSAHQARLRTRLRPRHGPRLLRGRDSARGRRDPRPEGDRRTRPGGPARAAS